MLSHDSMTYAARQNMSLFKLEYAQETSVSYLPQVCLINIRTDPTQLTIWVKYECDNQTYICIRPVAYSGDDDGHLQHDSSGGCLLLCGQKRLEGHFAREHPTLQVNQQPPSWSRNDIFQLRPTRTVGVPRVWEKIEEGIKSKASSRGPKKMVVIIIITIIIKLITIILIIIVIIIIVILIIAWKHISTMTSTHHGVFCPWWWWWKYDYDKIPQLIMTMMMMENFTYSKKNSLYRANNKSPSSQGPRKLGGKIGSCLEKKKFSGDGLGQAAGSCSPCGWGERSKLFFFPTWPIFSTSLLSSCFLDILVTENWYITSAPANMTIKKFKETKSDTFKGVPHSSLGYTLAHMLIFSKLHKVRCMCSMSSVIICIPDICHHTSYLSQTPQTVSV